MKKTTGFLLAAGLLLPAFPLHADASAIAPVKVRVTVQTDTVELDQAKLTVSDENSDGRLNMEDVCIAAHNSYYEGGAEAGYVKSCEDAPGCSVMWGVRGDYVSYIHDPTGEEKSGEPANGDQISIIAQSAAPEGYSFHVHTDKPIHAGEELEVELVRSGEREAQTEPVKNASILLDGQNTKVRTDHLGKAAIPIPESGIHQISAKLNGGATLMQNEEITVIPAAVTDTTQTAEITSADTSAITSETKESTTQETASQTASEQTSAVSSTSAAARTTESKQKSGSVKTGDSTPLAAFCGAGALAMAAILIIRSKKNSD